jgi:hypothetical protein
LLNEVVCLPDYPITWLMRALAPFALFWMPAQVLALLSCLRFPAFRFKAALLAMIPGEIRTSSALTTSSNSLCPHWHVPLLKVLKGV